VFLEAAHFAPAALAGRARKLGMHTDAAHRFERGVDAELPRRALERATKLILDAAGGSAGAIVEAVSREHLPVREAVLLRRARIERLLGIAVADAEVERIFAALDMRVERTTDGWRVTPPSRRFDIAIEEDLVEEVARIHGYERIPDRAPSGSLSAPSMREDRVGLAALRDQLVTRDYFEAITFAFVAPVQLAQWHLGDGALALANPLSADLAVMRTSLLPGLAAALVANRRRQQARVRLFEVGRVFAANGTETLRIAGVACGAAFDEQWGVAKRALDFFDVKGDVQSLLALTNAPETFAFAPAAPAWAHPGQCAALTRGGVVVGHVAAVHPDVRKALDLDDDVYAFELDIEPLAAREVPKAQALSRFPSVRRDLSFELPAEVPYAAVEAAIRDAVGETLADVVLFDRYVGEKLGGDIKVSPSA
jgi:phenylalanyl-tRNA synthetase beta chain